MSTALCSSKPTQTDPKTYAFERRIGVVAGVLDPPPELTVPGAGQPYSGLLPDVVAADKRCVSSLVSFL
jgi:hypothetical protein